MISCFTSKAEQKSINRKKTNKKSRTATTQEHKRGRNLSPLSSKLIISNFQRESNKRQSITAVFFCAWFQKCIKCNVTYNATTNAKSNVNCSYSYVLFYIYILLIQCIIILYNRGIYLIIIVIYNIYKGGIYF